MNIILAYIYLFGLVVFTCTVTAQISPKQSRNLLTDIGTHIKTKIGADSGNFTQDLRTTLWYTFTKMNYGLTLDGLSNHDTEDYVITAAVFALKAATENLFQLLDVLRNFFLSVVLGSFGGFVLKYVIQLMENI